jgi:uncharacterized surface protein with fasciclin (FAS1) repeats
MINDTSTLLTGQQLSVQVGEGGLLFIGTQDWAFAVQMTVQNSIASNGVLHIISGVLTYPGFVRPA